MKYYIADAFTEKLFEGNPAGVCILERKTADNLMQKIAMENNLSETAFVLKTKEGFELRWFTPDFEIDLCGHATLATAFVLSNFVEKGKEDFQFFTKSGILKVKKTGNLYEMSFPNKPMQQIAPTKEILEAVGIVPKEFYCERDLFLVLDTEKQVKEFVPNYSKLQKLSQWLGIVITAKGETADFVSRYFCPEMNAEDFVTGSSHCSLVPYWSKILEKTELTAKQLSKREGTLYCKQKDSHVLIAGKAVLYAVGELNF